MGWQTSLGLVPPTGLHAQFTGVFVLFANSARMPRPASLPRNTSQVANCSKTWAFPMSQLTWHTKLGHITVTSLEQADWRVLLFSSIDCMVIVMLALGKGSVFLCLETCYSNATWNFPPQVRLTYTESLRGGRCSCKKGWHLHLEENLHKTDHS